MTSKSESESAWPFPKSDVSNDVAADEHESVDPLEQKLADENVHHDGKVTRDMDSELGDEPRSAQS